jgi:hypothetical protein
MRILIALGALACALPACQAGNSAAHRSTEDPAPQSGTPRLPRVANAAREYRQARLEGPLDLRDGCLRVVVGAESYLIVWPAAATLQSLPDAVRIFDRRNGNSVQVGDRVELMGGAIAREQLGPGDLDAPLPEACSGPLWLTASFRKL